MLAWQQGDAAAACALVHAVSPTLLRYFLSQGEIHDHAEDILQETWLRVHKARASYRPGAPALPWLFAIARHARLDLYRRRARIARRELQMEMLPERPSPVRVDGVAGSALDLFGLLPDREREVLTMTKGLGMTLEEVARATASTVGAVKQLSHRAYVRLRSMMERSRPETTP